MKNVPEKDEVNVMQTLMTMGERLARIEANKVTPTAEQQLIATLSLRLAQLEAKS